MIPRALAYLRVSTDPQADADRWSLPDQERSIAEYCARRGYQLVRSYTDVFSGRRDDRPQYRAMLSALQTGAADIVVVKFLDRFGRVPRTILRHLWALQDLGVQVEATDEDLSHELLTMVKAGLAGEESKRTGERVRSAMRRLVEAGRTVGPLSLGLARDSQGRPVIDEVWAPRARLLFRLYVRGDSEHPLGLGYRLLAQHLNQRGLLTRAGRLWSASTVKAVLKDRALVGDLRQMGVASVLPPVACPGLFELAQRRMAARNGSRVAPLESPGKGQMLSGLLFCALCGKRMQTYTSSRAYQVRSGELRRSPDVYYMCGSRVDFGTCQRNSVGARRLNGLVLGQLVALTDEAAVYALVAAHYERAAGEREEIGRDRRRLQSEVARLDQEIASRIALRLRELIDDQQLAVASAAIRAQREALLSEQAVLASRERELETRVRPAAQIASAVAIALAKVASAPLAEARAVLGGIVERVEWDGHSATIHLRL